MSCHHRYHNFMDLKPRGAFGDDPSLYGYCGRRPLERRKVGKRGL